MGDPPKARTPDALVTDSLPATHPGCPNHVAYHSMGRGACQEEIYQRKENLYQGKENLHISCIFKERKKEKRSLGVRTSALQPSVHAKMRRLRLASCRSLILVRLPCLAPHCKSLARDAVTLALARSTAHIQSQLFHLQDIDGIVVRHGYATAGALPFRPCAGLLKVGRQYDSCCTIRIG